MLIKIKGNSKRLFEDNVKKVMNIACVVSRYGSLPTDADIIQSKEPERSSEFWYEDVKKSKFELFPLANNNKAFVRERGENFIVIEFHFRYDGRGLNGTGRSKSEALSNLILAIFDDSQVELV